VPGGRGRLLTLARIGIQIQRLQAIQQLLIHLEQILGQGILLLLLLLLLQLIADTLEGTHRGIWTTAPSHGRGRGRIGHRRLRLLLLLLLLLQILEVLALLIETT